MSSRPSSGRRRKSLQARHSASHPSLRQKPVRVFKSRRRSHVRIAENHISQREPVTVSRLASTCRPSRVPLPSSPIASPAAKTSSPPRGLQKNLTARDIAVLRFDFTGIGSSEGEFANTNFSSNVRDLVAAAGYLRQNHAAPSLLIGHSLGGAAMLAAAPHMPEATAIVHDRCAVFRRPCCA